MRKEYREKKHKTGEHGACKLDSCINPNREKAEEEEDIAILHLWIWAWDNFLPFIPLENILLQWASFSEYCRSQWPSNSLNWLLQLQISSVHVSTSESSCAHICTRLTILILRTYQHSSVVEASSSFRTESQVVCADRRRCTTCLLGTVEVDKWSEQRTTQCVMEWNVLKIHEQLNM